MIRRRLAGVVVLEKGRENNAAITNSNGEYTLQVSSQNAVLEFSYLGYEKTDR